MRKLRAAYVKVKAFVAKFFRSISNVQTESQTGEDGSNEVRISMDTEFGHISTPFVSVSDLTTIAKKVL